MKVKVHHSDLASFSTPDLEASVTEIETALTAFRDELARRQRHTVTVADESHLTATGDVLRTGAIATGAADSIPVILRTATEGLVPFGSAHDLARDGSRITARLDNHVHGHLAQLTISENGIPLRITLGYTLQDAKPTDCFSVKVESLA